MVDDPMSPHFQSGAMVCTTLEEKCQDCRQVDITDIYSAHFTMCHKPWRCGNRQGIHLCRELRFMWHRLRLEAERGWTKEYPGYSPTETGGISDYPLALFYCKALNEGGEEYIPMRFPIEANLTG
jgi:phage FluMu protein Com